MNRHQKRVLVNPDGVHIADISSITSKQLFDKKKILKALCNDFIGRKEVIQTLLVLLQTSRSFVVCGRCNDKIKLVTTTCEKAGFVIVHVDCTLVESTADFFDYVLTRIEVELACEGKKYRHCNAHFADSDISSKKRQKHNAATKNQTIGQRLMFGPSLQVASKKSSSHASSLNVTKNPRLNFARCTKRRDFICRLREHLLPPVSHRQHRGKHVTLVLSNASHLSSISRDLIDVLLRHIPDRMRLIFITSAPPTILLRKNCPLLHVPYLSQDRMIENLCREFELQTSSSLPSITHQYRFYVQHMCSIMQSRRALRNASELRYLIITSWPSFAKAAQDMNPSQFKSFVRAALQQRGFLNEAHDSLFAHDTLPPTFEFQPQKNKTSRIADSVADYSGNISNWSTDRFSFSYLSRSCKPKTVGSSDIEATEIGSGHAFERHSCVVSLRRRKTIMDLPKLMKFVLLSSYLCSHIPETEHGRIFSPRFNTQKNRSANRKRRNSSKRGREAAPFVVERLIAVCHSIISSYDGETCSDLDPGEILSNLAMLQQMRLVTRISHEAQLNEPRFRSNFDHELLMVIAHSVADRSGKIFEIGRYLAAGKPT